MTDSTPFSSTSPDIDHAAPLATPGRAGVRAGDVVKVLAITASFALGCLLLITLAPLIVSLSVAAFLAVAADPAVRFFQKYGLSRMWAVLAFTACLVVLLAALVAIFVPPLIDQAGQLADDAPGYVEQVRDEPLVRDLDEQFGVVDSAADYLNDLPGKVGGQIDNVLGAIFAGVFGTLTVLFMMVLLLLGGADLTRGIVRVFPKVAERRWWRLVQDSYRSISGYVAGTMLIAFLAGLVVLVAALALGLPSPLPLALWMALLDVIPLVGATIGAVPIVVVAFVAGGVVKGLVILGIVLAYQQFENLVLQPAILGRVVSLSPIVVFVAILAGSQLLGIIGALLAIPVAGVGQIFLREWLSERMDEELDAPPIAPDAAPGAPAAPA